MKKTIICCIALLVCLPGFAGAEYSAENLKKGFVLGVNSSNVSGADFDTKSRTGYCVGAFINYQSSERLSYQLELLFNGKGYRRLNVINYDTLGEAYTIDEVSTILSYIEVPITTKFTIVPTGKYRPYLLGGGFAGILVGDKLRFKDEGGPILDVGIENTKSADVGVLIGGGIDLKAGVKSWVSFEVRYELSFISPIQNVDYKSRVLGFRAGYWF
ncbi:MAG: porin family protein [Candidatus Zixiibacteriota bacterium]